jgi:death-on-curing protein
MQFLELALVIDLHRGLIVTFGGASGIRDKRLLESAISYPQLLYSIAMEHDVCTLASAYCYHLVKNHPFVDGNKRIGTLTMLTFLKMNGVLCIIPKSKLYKLIIDVASSKGSEEDIVAFLKLYIK